MCWDGWIRFHYAYFELNKLELSSFPQHTLLPLKSFSNPRFDDVATLVSKPHLLKKKLKILLMLLSHKHCLNLLARTCFYVLHLSFPFVLNGLLLCWKVFGKKFRRSLELDEPLLQPKCLAEIPHWEIFELDMAFKSICPFFPWMKLYCLSRTFFHTC